MTRSCGDCQLCCRLMPTAEIDKPANVRCQHQRVGKGCAIHSRKPASCSLWSCRWLLGDDTADQARPDRSGIVLDMMPDFVRATDNATGKATNLPVIVAWIDPARPDAWQDAKFVRYVARQTQGVLLRLGSRDSAGALFPPAVTGTAEVIYQPAEMSLDMPATLEAKAAALGATVELPHDEGGLVTEAVFTMPGGRKVRVAAL